MKEGVGLACMGGGKWVWSDIMPLPAAQGPVQHRCPRPLLTALSHEPGIPPLPELDINKRKSNHLGSNHSQYMGVN